MTTHQGFPGLTIMSNGDLLVAYRESTNHDVVNGTNRGILKGKTSSDDGATWSSAFTIHDDSGDEYDTRDTALLTLANGRVLACLYMRSAPPPAPIVTKEGITYSDDNASTWTDVALTNSFTDWAVPAGGGVQLANGDVLWPLYGQDSGDSRQSVRVSKSTDNGATWSALAEVADGQSDGRSYQEPSLLLLANGNVVCFMRTSVDLFYTSTSTDNGATWSTPTSTGVSGSGRPLPLLTSTGKIVMPYRVGAAAPNGALLAYSDDDGATWTSKVVFDLTTGRNYVYSQMAEISPTAIAIAYAYDDKGTASGNNGTVLFDYLIADGVTRP